MRHVAALAAVVAALALAGTAGAAVTNYYGYAWISSTSPPAGTCPGWDAGMACSGWNYWDYSQIDIRTTAIVIYGFIFRGGWFHMRYVWGPATYTALWSSFGSSATHYNRAGCRRHASPAYVQCRALIF